MTVGNKIRMLRKSMGLTQTELGERIGVQKNAVSKWECGRVEDIPMSTVKALAFLFHVSPSYLIEDDIILSPEAQKIAEAYDKATAKEKKMVQLALSDYLEEHIQQVRIAALSNDGSAIDFSGADPDAEMPGDFTEGPAIP